MSKLLIVVFAIVLLGGCAQGPKPKPVDMMQIGDMDLTCNEIAAEYEANTVVAGRKIEENNSADSHDVFMALFVSPLMVDTQNAPGHEGNALLDRNERLISIAGIKECGLQTVPQPERYQ